MQTGSMARGSKSVQSNRESIPRGLVPSSLELESDKRCPVFLLCFTAAARQMTEEITETHLAKHSNNQYKYTPTLGGGSAVKCTIIAS